MSYSAMDSLSIRPEGNQYKSINEIYSTTNTAKGSLDTNPSFDITVSPGARSYLDLSSAMLEITFKTAQVTGAPFSDAGKESFCANILGLFSQIEMYYNGQVVQSLLQPMYQYATNAIMERTLEYTEQNSALDNLVLPYGANATFDARDDAVGDWTNITSKAKTNVALLQGGSAEVTVSIRLKDLFTCLDSGFMFYSSDILFRFNKIASGWSKIMTRKDLTDTPVEPGRLVLLDCCIRAQSLEVSDALIGDVVQAINSGPQLMPFIDVTSVYQADQSLDSNLHITARSRLRTVFAYPIDSDVFNSEAKLPMTCTEANLSYARLRVGGQTYPNIDFRLTNSTQQNYLYKAYQFASASGKYSDVLPPLLSKVDFLRSMGPLVFEIQDSDSRTQNNVELDYAFSAGFPGGSITWLIVLYNERDAIVDQKNRVITFA